MRNYSLDNYESYPLDSIDFTQNVTHTTQIQSFPIKRALKVSELTAQLKSVIDSDFRYVEVEGEITNFGISKGHMYFKLKDEDSILSCIFFSFKYKNSPIAKSLKNGDKIIAKGPIKIYGPHGTYSLNLESCEYSGVGDLYMQYQNLREELQKKGYFDDARKKPLPRFPKRIIFLTSANGAAIQDMKKIAQERYPLCEFILINTLVQGPSAKFSIAKNLSYADNLKADIIVLGRGGGSFEDLFCFSELPVLDAILACKTPVVSAVGHQSDCMLSDFVADVRAPTPSAAMEMILPDKNTLFMNLIDLDNLLRQNINNLVAKKKDSFLFLSKNIELLSPAKKISMLKERLNNLQHNLLDSINLMIFNKKGEISLLKSKLNALNPTNNIEKMRLKSQNLNSNLQDCLNTFLRNKKGEISSLESSLNHTFKLFLTQKKSLLNIEIDSALKSFMDKKQMRLTNLEQILKSTNPQNRIQKGFVQVLRDNKIMQVSDLKSGDKIELVDASGSVGARVE